VGVAPSRLPTPQLLSEADYGQRVRFGPLLSLDLIIRDRQDRVLLALRNDEPAKGLLFVPGGVVLKNEPIEAAFARIAMRELGWRLGYDKARLRGVYQHFYLKSRLETDGSGTHYVVLAHDVAIDDAAAIRLDATHSACRWLSAAAVLENPDVHEYVKDYFRPARRTQHAAM
jgi:colanic acid biosynthesis protein WcaH